MLVEHTREEKLRFQEVNGLVEITQPEELDLTGSCMA